MCQTEAFQLFACLSDEVRHPTQQPLLLEKMTNYMMEKVSHEPNSPIVWSVLNRLNYEVNKTESVLQVSTYLRTLTSWKLTPKEWVNYFPDMISYVSESWIPVQFNMYTQGTKAVYCDDPQCNSKEKRSLEGWCGSNQEDTSSSSEESSQYPKGCMNDSSIYASVEAQNGEPGQLSDDIDVNLEEDNNYKEGNPSRCQRSPPRTPVAVTMTVQWRPLQRLPMKSQASCQITVMWTLRMVMVMTAVMRIVLAKSLSVVQGNKGIPSG